MTPPPKKVYQDEWDTGHHEAYEERPVYQPRKVVKQRKANGFLGAVGGLLIVGGIFWGTYLLSSGRNTSVLLTFPGPVWVAGAGVVVSLVARYIG